MKPLGVLHMIWGLTIPLQRGFVKPLGFVHTYIHTYGHFSHFSTDVERGGRDGGQVPPKTFIRNCMNYADLHRKMMFLTIHCPMEVQMEESVTKNVFTRNWLRWSDLQRKVMFLTPKYHRDGVKHQNLFSLELLDICRFAKKNHVSKAPVHTGGGKNPKKFLGIARNRQICTEKSYF